MGIGVLGAVIGTLTFVLQDRLPWYDDAAHFLAVTAFTFVLGVLLWRRVLRGAWTHPFLFVFVVAAAGLGLAAAWESIEWAFHQLGFDIVQGIGDTETDLMMDFLGACVGAVACLIVVRGLDSRTRQAPADEQIAAPGPTARRVDSGPTARGSGRNRGPRTRLP